jgi:predicted ATPase
MASGEQIAARMRDYERLGFRLCCSAFLALAAERHTRAGELDKANERLTAALAHVEETGERFYTAEIHRLRGELWLASAKGQRRRPNRQLSEAEECLQLALRTAGAQRAKLWELRAAVSLVRLGQRQQGESTGARTLLESVYASFAGGGDAADVREAGNLLANTKE